MDRDRENTTEGRVRYVSVRYVLSTSGAGSVTLWGGDRVLYAAMSKHVEGVNVVLLRQVKVSTSKQQRDGTWRNVAAASVPK